MQTFLRALLYIVCGLVIFAISFCMIAGLVSIFFPLSFTLQDVALLGAAIGAVLGFVYGLTRRFQ